jgi:hypothetical protein
MTYVFTEKKRRSSRTVTFHEFCLFYFAPQNQSYQEEELETVISNLFEFIYIFRLTQVTRILCVPYVHYNVIQSIFMGVVTEMQSLHKRESMSSRERPLLYKQWIP